MSETTAWKVLARELTAWELMRRIKDGYDIALLPIGCMEMHGPQLPLGTDTFKAEAIWCAIPNAGPMALGLRLAMTSVSSVPWTYSIAMMCWLSRQPIW